MMVVRKALPADKARVLTMAKRFHEQSAVHFPFSAAHASLLFDQSLTDPDRLCLVIEDDGVHGALSAQTVDYHLAGIRVATETFWWVSPRHWRSMPELLSEYEDWATFRGASVVGMGMIGGRCASNIFVRHGYARAEQMYSKRVVPLI